MFWQGRTLLPLSADSPAIKAVSPNEEALLDYERQKCV
jgi:hypothetical protein